MNRPQTYNFDVVNGNLMDVTFANSDPTGYTASMDAFTEAGLDNRSLEEMRAEQFGEMFLEVFYGDLISVGGNGPQPIPLEFRIDGYYLNGKKLSPEEAQAIINWNTAINDLISGTLRQGDETQPALSKSSLHWTDGIGPGLVVIGGPWIPKNSTFARMIFSRSAAVMRTKQTTTSLFSLSAHGLSKKFGLSFIGGTTTKAVPIIGWVWTAHDVLRLTVPAYDQFHIDFNEAQQTLPGSGPSYMGSDGIFVCFVGGTKIYADNGLVDIETLQEGMEVYSYNFESEQLELKPITMLYKRGVQGVYSLTIGREEINVTSEHPFYVDGKGWVKVKDLRESDLLRTSKDKRKEIKKITKKQQAVTVYNIEVDGNHNYFVGRLKVLVHNK